MTAEGNQTLIVTLKKKCIHESQQLDIDDKPDGNKVSVLGSMMISEGFFFFVKRHLYVFLLIFITRILFNLHNFGHMFLQTKKRKRGRQDSEACTGGSCQISLEPGK